MSYQGTSPATGASLSQTLYRDYRKIFMDEYKRATPQWQMFAKTQTLDSRYWKEGSMATFGAFTTRREGQSPSFQVLTQGPEKEVTVTGYGSAFAVTREALKDDIHGMIKKAPAALATACQYTLETLFWDILNSGFVTTVRTGLDSLALFTASHTTIGSGTQSNLGTASVLNETSLEAALLHFKLMKNEKGINIPGAKVPKYLVIPPDLSFRARRLLGGSERPETMDRDINVNQNALQIVEVPWLSSTTAWFVLAEDHDLRLGWRDMIEYDAYDDPKTKSSVHDGTFRLFVEFYDWRGAYGNAGA